MLLQKLTRYLLTLIIPTFIFNLHGSPSVCLNMIVRNESKVISRCLESVKPLIDYWVIVDTGSNDGTQDIIKSTLKDIPGQLHEVAWVDFSHARNKALEYAKAKGDYVLVIDADEVLVFSENFKWPQLDKDFYYIETNLSGTCYQRVQLINNHLLWRWEGVVHECLVSPEAKNFDRLTHISNYPKPDGNRSKNPKKYDQDISLLEEALKKNPGHTRNVFYLAQSYRDAGRLEEALATYQKRADMGGWDQEVFWSFYQIGLIKEALDKDSQEIIQSYLQAYKYRSTRAEPLYRLAQFQRKLKNFDGALEASSLGLRLKKSTDILFVEDWISDYGLLLEYSLATYWKELYLESFLATRLLLANPKLPKNYQECADKNLTWILKKLDTAGKICLEK